MLRILPTWTQSIPLLFVLVFTSHIQGRELEVGGDNATPDDKISLPVDSSGMMNMGTATDDEAELAEADIGLTNSDDATDAAPLPLSKPVSDEVTLEYYQNEPVFSLYISQMGENFTQDNITMGDECMTHNNGANLYRSKQKVINGGCFGDLDDRFDNVLLEGTSDDRAPESFQVFATGDPNMVDLKRFMGSKQCELCMNNRCEAMTYTLPINECFYWRSNPDAGDNFFTVVSRTDPLPNVTLSFYDDDACTTQYGTTLTGGGTDMCIGAKRPSPGASYDEGYEFRKPISDESEGPIQSYDVSRWIRGTECREGFRSNFFGTAKQETVAVAMNKCTPWVAKDKRTFYVKLGLGTIN